MNVIGSLLCVLAAIELKPRWVTVGLGGSLAVSYFIGAWITIRALQKFEIFINIREVAGFYAKLFGIAFLVGFPIHISQRHLPGGNILKLIEVLGISGIGYLALAKLLRIAEVTGVLQLLPLRKR